MREHLEFWLAVLTFMFIIQGSAFIYFVNWVLWRWNTVLTKMNIEQHLSTRSEEE